MSFFTLDFIKKVQKEAEVLLGPGGLVSHIEHCIAMGIVDFNEIVTKAATVLGIPLEDKQKQVGFYTMSEIVANPELLSKVEHLFDSIVSSSEDSATSIALLKTILRKS